MKIAILAAGTWGTALAKILAKKNSVKVWSIVEEEIKELSATRKHKNLPGMIIPDSVLFTTDMKLAAADADVIIFATPSTFIRSTSEKIKSLLNPGQILACVAKGIEADTLFTMSEVINDVVQGSNPVVALSGPTHAEEVALDLPTLIVSSSRDLAAAKKVQNLFVGTCIRPYTNNDIKGVELCGALKNIMALACGISVGLGYGDNTKAAIITRGMAEIKHLGMAMGCVDETFSGLAGMGDLIVTAMSQHSRNNRAGQYIGQGMKVSDAVKKVGMVVEGINALPAAMKLSAKYGIELPIISSVNDIVCGGMLPKDAVKKLLSRNIKSELTAEEAELRYEKELLK